MIFYRVKIKYYNFDLLGILENQRRESDDTTATLGNSKTALSLDELDKRTGRLSDQTYLSQFQSMNDEVLLTMLKETKSLHEEADILHYLFETK